MEGLESCAVILFHSWKISSRLLAILKQWFEKWCFPLEKKEKSKIISVSFSFVVLCFSLFSPYIVLIKVAIGNFQITFYFLDCNIITSFTMSFFLLQTLPCTHLLVFFQILASFSLTVTFLKHCVEQYVLVPFLFHYRDKYYYQKQLGEEWVYFILCFQVPIHYWRTSGQQLKQEQQEPWKKTTLWLPFWLMCSSLSYIPQDHLLV